MLIGCWLMTDSECLSYNLQSEPVETLAMVKGQSGEEEEEEVEEAIFVVVGFLALNIWMKHKELYFCDSLEEKRMFLKTDLNTGLDCLFDFSTFIRIFIFQFWYSLCVPWPWEGVLHYTGNVDSTLHGKVPGHHPHIPGHVMYYMTCITRHISHVTYNITIPHATFHLSYVSCQMSQIQCHRSHVTGHMSEITYWSSNDKCHTSQVVWKIMCKISLING